MKKQLFLITVMITLTTVGQTFTNYTTADGLIPGGIYEILQDDNGDIWCVGWTAPDTPGIARFDGTTWTQFGTADGAHSDTMVSALQDSNGNYWFGGVSFFGDDGASRFDGTT